MCGRVLSVFQSAAAPAAYTFPSHRSGFPSWSCSQVRALPKGVLPVDTGAMIYAHSRELAQGGTSVRRLPRD